METLKNLVSDEMKELIDTVKTVAEEDIPLENPGEETRYPGAFSDLMPLDDALKGLHGTEDLKSLQNKKEKLVNALDAIKDLEVDDSIKALLENVKTAAEEDIPLENPGADTRYPGVFSDLMPLEDALKGLHASEDVKKNEKIAAAIEAIKEFEVDDHIKSLIETAKTAAEEDIPLENPGVDTRYPGVFSDLMPLDDALKGLHASEDKKK